MLRAGLLVAVATLALTGCSMEEASRFGYLEPITPQGENIIDLYRWSTVAALVVGAFVWGLIFFACIRYRKRGDEMPRQVRYNLPIEVLYTVVPFVIVAVLFYYTAISQNFINELTPEDEGGPELAVDVVGFQWNWQFNYRSYQGEPFGEGGRDPIQVTGQPGAPPEMVLPTDTTVRFVQTSPDVIHAFFVPQFLFKRDNLPGRPNQFEITLDREGVFIGRCAEFCGADHNRMNFQVRVVPPEQFEVFVDDPAEFYEQFAPDPRVVPGQDDPLETTADAAPARGTGDADSSAAPVTTPAGSDQ
jgi:cytochrome c oxidase subunit II